jgi:hypothetical protein
MRAYEFIVEERKGLYNYYKQQFPTWPDYVVRDFAVKNSKNFTTAEAHKEWIAMAKQEFDNHTWQLHKELPLSLDKFDAITQKRMADRQMGQSNPYGVPKDAERHELQKQMIQQRGVSPEPVILRNTPGGYNAIEGWHRTMQHLNAYPQGYKGPAWVATPTLPADVKAASVKGGGGNSDLADPANWQSGIEDVFQTSFDPKRTAQQIKYDAFKRGY